jgi:MFS family permease
VCRSTITTSLRAVPHRDHTLTSVWPADSPAAATALTPRDDLLREVEVAPGEFAQDEGPFRHYRRTVVATATEVTETIVYKLSIPWFGALFSLPVRRVLHHRPSPGQPTPWWAPPDRLNERQMRSLALLAAAAASAAFANTLFTQTANFVADAFGVGDSGQGVGGAIVRLGVLIALPFAVVADRLGRRRTIVLTAWLAPLVCALGAAAPSFWLLVATQTVGRPLGIALALLASVAAAEDMPRNSRAYALSLLAMAAGLGAGVAVGSVKLADVGDEGWRLGYLLSLVWIPVAVSLMRHLLETRRFQTVHTIAQPMNGRRLALVATVVLASSLFVAPASFFQNRYLNDVRGFSAGGIALFTLLTATPASIGLILGGRLADVVGRRVLIAVFTPLSTVFLVIGFSTGGWLMWVSVMIGAVGAAIAHPAYAVYRTELFPTGNRGRANGVVTTIGLLSGSVGILAVGIARDRGYSFGAVMAVMGVGQLVAAYMAYRHYPETAHLELEELNPEDPVLSES